MKKIIALLLAAIMVLGLAACASKTEPAADTTTAEPAAEPAETTEETPAAEEETPAAEEEAPAADDVKHVVYIVNGNLGDKSFFDSAQAGINKLIDDGRITCDTIELGGLDEDQPKWLSTLYDVSESGEYDLVICGTYQMPDYLKEVATQYPDQLYLIFDDNTYAGNNSNVVNITYKQNDMGYLVGTYAACMTTDTNLDKINEDAVVGFVGGVDSDQELTFSDDLAALTLTSGLKNIGNSIIWIFDQWDAGKTYWGTEVQLGLAEGGVGIVTDKNYDKYASAETKAAVEAAQAGIMDGSTKVDTAFDANFDVAALRDSVRP